MDHQALLERQLELEEESVALGALRYTKEKPMPWRSTTAQSKDESDLPPGKRLLNLTTEKVADAITEWAEKSRSGKAGRKSTLIKYLDHIDPLAAAYITAKACINGATKRSAFQTTAVQIGTIIKEHLEWKSLREEHRGLAVKLERQLQRTTHYQHRRKVINHTMRKSEIESLGWSDRELLFIGTKLIEIFIEVTGLFALKKNTKSKKRTVYHLTPTEETSRWLEEQHARCEILSPVHLPMIVPPRDWATPYSGGYLQDLPACQFVKTRNRAYLDELGSVEMPQVYNAVNSIQATPWRINRKVLSVLREVWQSGGSLGALPSRDDEDLPPKPVDIATNEEAKTAWKSEAAKVHELNARSRSKRLAMSQKLWIAERFEKEEEIYFPHALDFRARVYPLPPFVNPQADDSGKALLEFASGKPIGKLGAYWMAIHIANLFGIDKVSFEDRVQFVLDNEDAILDSAREPLDGQRFWATADEPYGALAACMEWAGYVEEGEEYVSHLPVNIDATCSGLQHYAAMMLDVDGSRSVNLMPSETPEDIYLQVAETVQAFADASTDEEALPWQGGKVLRKIAKRPVMTYCYSATRFGMQAMIESELRKIDEDRKGRAEGPLLEGASNYKAAMWLSHVIYKAIGDTVTSAQSAMGWLRAAARVTAEAGLPLYWTNPVGFPVLQEYKHFTSRRHDVYFAGRRIQLALAAQDKEINARRQVFGVAPNFIHSMDSGHLLAACNAAQDAGILSMSLIHDSFGTHAADVNQLGNILRETFIDQYSVDRLTMFRDELASQLPPAAAKQLPEPPIRGDLDVSLVMDSPFIFS